ncbi:hypothetical protein PSACC_02845 [Paramicrosporidium saccamoebae]|uniref:Uncharacterized protein n=1 Tax=Paramicrosporidium saccamoebae TaxID=1246581 RepID=A0A2H9TI08_9FUNG|nr:hypothetical protein PSACC_02845 [Paramicrosporidium saccamoebae]
MGLHLTKIVHEVGAAARFHRMDSATTSQSLEDTVLVGIFAAVVVFQYGLLLWKRKHPNTYLLTSLFLLWVFPLFIAINNSFWRFTIVWLIYSATNYRVIRAASQPKLDPKTPRFVYRFYRGLFNVTMGIAAFGYGLFLVNAFIFPTATMIDLSITLVFYGLYFGVLSRDLVEYGADRMATTIGVRLFTLFIS